MEPYKNILAVIDRQSNFQNTFLKSIYLSKRSGAKLTLLETHLNSKNEQSDELAFILRQNKINFEIKQSKKMTSYKGILQTLNQDEYDLIVKEKSAKHHTFLGLKPSDDWHLLRDSPVPVMLVTQRKWQADGHILSAIETESQENSHLKINQNILEHTYCLSDLLDSDVHLLNCFLGENMSMAIECKPVINQKLLHLQHLANLSGNAVHSPAKLHVCEGLPEYGVSELAEEYHANMVVLGTSEHANFINNLTGHTSEYIIDKLACDVLAIKSSEKLIH